MEQLAHRGPGHHRIRRDAEDFRGARREGDEVGGGIPAPVAEARRIERETQPFGVGGTGGEWWRGDLIGRCRRGSYRARGEWADQAGSARQRAFERLVQHLAADRLGHVIDRAVLAHLHDGLHFLRAADGDDDGLGPALADFLREPHAVVDRHDHIREHDLGRSPSSSSLSAASAPCAVDDLVSPLRQPPEQDFANRRFIIDNKNPRHAVAQNFRAKRRV